MEGCTQALRRRPQRGAVLLAISSSFFLSGGRRYGKVARRFSRLRDDKISPRCSISPQGLATAYTLLAAVAIGIGIGFAALGAWLVLPFAGLEALALAVAFFAIARRIADDERMEQ